MKSFTTFAAVVLVLVIFCSSASFALVSPYGRYGVGGIDPTEDHPWGGDQIIADPQPQPQPGPIGTTAVWVSHPVVFTGNTTIDLFLNRLFDRFSTRRSTPMMFRSTVNPNTSSSGTTTTRTIPGSTN